MNYKKWTANNITDQSGRIAVITGSSSGIGYETARVLANKNANVILAVRNLQKGESALQKIKAQNKDANTEVMILDLANLQSIKKFVDKFKQKYDKLDLLINNAGVMIPPYTKTIDGFELQFGTNHLGHFALTGLLIDLVFKTKNSRIVNVSSGAHRYGNINFDDLSWEKRRYKKWRAYGDSKIANLYFTYELQRILEQKSSGTLVTAAHPGWTATDLQRYSKIIEFLNPIFAMKSEQGVLPILRAAIDKFAKSGDYYGPDGWREIRGFPVKVVSNRLSNDKKIAKKLWDMSEELTKVKYNFGLN